MPRKTVLCNSDSFSQNVFDLEGLGKSKGTNRENFLDNFDVENQVQVELVRFATTKPVVKAARVIDSLKKNQDRLDDSSDFFRLC